MTAVNWANNHISFQTPAPPVFLECTSVLSTAIICIYLPIRVDHWDLEKERIVILTDNNIISVKYNFIQQQVEELKYIPIGSITEALFGDFKYPYSYA